MTLRERFEKAWAEVTGRASCVVQDKEELFALIALMHARGVRSYLELGASEGVSLYCIGMCLEKPLLGVVDLFEDHSRQHLEQNIAYLRDAGCVCMSYEGKTSEAAETVLSRTWDAILIDADHAYTSVKEDWEVYGKSGKMVAFHDIRMRDSVGLVWEKARNEHSLEIHNASRKERWGFGVRFNNE